MSRVEKILTTGLAEVYAGKSKLVKAFRGIFPLKVGTHKTDDGYYHDEWLSGDFLGGGQELAGSNNSGESETRLYYGGTLPQQQLLDLGTSKAEVISKLKGYILEFGEKTRLFDDCLPKKVGDWQYKYVVTINDVKFSTTLARESITFKDVAVFRHYFILGPIK